MEQVYEAMIDVVGWINEEYGSWAGWTAAMITLVGFAALLSFMFAWLVR